MTTELLEQRLREKVAPATPRPGFETRIQAMAREPLAKEKKSLFRRVAVPALAVCAIFVVIAPKDRKNQRKVAEEAPVSQPVPVETAENEPVHREIEGLKNDARWTMGLFRKALPSIPPPKDKEQEEE